MVIVSESLSLIKVYLLIFHFNDFYIKTDFTKQKLIFVHQRGKKIVTVYKRLFIEDIRALRQGHKYNLMTFVNLF